MPDPKLRFDVVVVGSGPAGIAAAAAAAESGKTVALVDSSPGLGGQIWRGKDHGSPNTLGGRWIQRLQASGTRIFSGATVFATGPEDTLLAEQGTHLLQFSWDKLIIATGAREIFLPFPGWTLPGVVGPGGLHAMAKEGWPVQGKRVVVAGTGPLLLAVAEGLRAHGASVPLIAEQSPWARVMAFGAGLWQFPGKLLQALTTRASLFSVPYRCGCWPVKVEGNGHVESVTLTNGQRTWTKDCDYLACGFHLTPNLELPLLLNCAVTNGFVQASELQETSIPSIYCAGEPTGIAGAESALLQGQIAGYVAADCLDRACALLNQSRSWRRFAAALCDAFALRAELRSLSAPDTIFCRCEDIRCGQVSGFTSWRAAKLQTRCGMGPCQGRTCGTAARVLFGWEPGSVRPPIFPVTTASLSSETSSTTTSSAVCSSRARFQEPS